MEKEIKSKERIYSDNNCSLKSININSSLKESQFFGEVNCIKSIIYENKEYLVIGKGYYIQIMNISDKRIIFEEKLNDKISILNAYNDFVLVSAETNLYYFKVQSAIKLSTEIKDNSLLKKTIIRKFELQADDYILNVKTIQLNQDIIDSKEVLIIGYMSNFLDIYSIHIINDNGDLWSLSSNKISRIICPEKCLLYSMDYYFSSANSKLVIASGSVFRFILLWEVELYKYKEDDLNGNYLEHSITNVNYLTGHLGVIFKTKFVSEGELISVSDDRTVRYWNVNNKIKLDNSIENNSNIPPITFIGHTARVWNVEYIKVRDEEFILSVGEDTTCRIFNLTKAKLSSLEHIDNNNNDVDLLTGEAECNSFSPFKGKNVRAICVGNNEAIYIGGDDGNIFSIDSKRLITHNDSNSYNNSNFDHSINHDYSDYLVSINAGYIKSIKSFQFHKINTILVFITTSKGILIKSVITKTNIKNTIIYQNQSNTEFCSLEVYQKFDNEKKEDLFDVYLGDVKGNLIIGNIFSSDETITILNKSKILNFKLVVREVMQATNSERIIVVSNPLDEVALIKTKLNDKMETCITNTTKNNEESSYYLKLKRFVFKVSEMKAAVSCFKIINYNSKSINKENNENNNNFVLIIGDIRGKLGVYVVSLVDEKDKAEQIMYYQTFSKVHNKEPITSIYIEDIKYNSNMNINEVFLTTTGKDGKVLSNHIIISENENNQNKISISSSNSLAFQNLTNIEALIIKSKFSSNYLNNNDKQDTKQQERLLLGSYGNNLILHNQSQDIEIFKQNISGLNRIFDYSLCNDNTLLFSSLNNKSITITKINTNIETNIITNISSRFVSGKIIHSIKIIDISESVNLIFTASEDTKINIYYSFNNEISYITRIEKHTGAIRCLSIINKAINEDLVLNSNSNNRNQFFEILFSSCGSSSECFVYLFKGILVLNDNGNKQLVQEALVTLIYDFSFPSHNLDTRIMFSNVYSNLLGFVDTLNCFYLCSLEGDVCDSIIKTNKNIGKENTYYTCNRLNNSVINTKSNDLKSKVNIKHSINLSEIKYDYIPLCFSLFKFSRYSNHSNVGDSFTSINNSNLLSCFGTTNGVILIQEISSSNIVFKKQFHQAGLNALEIIENYDKSSNDENDYTVLLFSVGEDSYINIIELTYNKTRNSNFILSSIIKSININSSSLKSIRVIPKYNNCIDEDKGSSCNNYIVVAAGYDQLVSVSEIIISNESKEMIENNKRNDKLRIISKNFTSSVNEINSVDFIFSHSIFNNLKNNNDHITAVISGHGFEMSKVNINN